MPIGDLLAEISGEKPSAAPVSAVKSSTVLKRKADGDSAGNGLPSKVVKQSHSATRDALSRKPSPAPPARSTTVAKPPAAAAPSNGQRTGATSTVTSRDKPYTGTATLGRVNRKPEAINTLPRRDAPASSVRPSGSATTLGAPRVASAKPSPTTPTSAGGPSKAPKKGSFAEIMARGAKAQQIAPKAGTIQHKAIGQTVMSKKGDEGKSSKWKLAKNNAGASSNTLPSREKSAQGAKNGISKDSRPVARGSGRPSPAVDNVTEKKIKKAAAASTGYTGTARAAPKKAPDAKSSKSASSRPRPGGGLLALPRTRRREQYEEDSDMDDFIDDDEGMEDDAPRGYRYADEYDSDSDMEAGADDIYAEEQRALRQAREDDAKEEALLEKLRKDKERRRAGY
ncbi:hypothetical protein KJ359_002788 [Pestalotiopsis sp. 9143b]|nr:hypothetical protein KJ359_002788 [Pestalotiopsis sp. 9143b]